MNFNFKTIQNTRDIKGLIDFLMKQSLNYPGYEDWVQRTESEIDIGYKKAILAFSYGHLVGDLIYQPHKELPRVREIKNERIHEDFRNRYLANFMLRQVECESPEEFDVLICDVREDREAEISMLRRFGYTQLATRSLYDPNIQDIIFIKILNPNASLKI